MELVVGGTAVATAAAGAIYHFCLRDRSQEYEEQALTALFHKVVGEQEKADPNEMRTQIKNTGYTEKDLSLCYERLRCFPIEACSFKHLTHLAAHDNHLPSIPREIGQLTSLVYVNLEKNHIAALPSEFGQLRALEIVILRHNQIAALPSDMQHLTKMHRLILADNCLSALAIDFSKLLELRQLDVACNPIEQVDPSISALIRLACQDYQVGRIGLIIDDRSKVPKDFCYLENVLSSRRKELKTAAYESCCAFGENSPEDKAGQSQLDAFDEAIKQGRLPACIQNPYLRSKLKQQGWNLTSWIN